MIIIKFVRWLYKILNGVEKPWQIALAFGLGFAFAMPPFGLVTLFGLILILFINCHFGSGLFGLGVGMLLSKPLLGPQVADPLGTWILETGPHEFFKTMAASDGLALFRAHWPGTIGGLALGMLLFPVVFFIIYILVAKYREAARNKLGRSKLMKTMGNMMLFRILRWVFIG